MGAQVIEGKAVAKSVRAEVKTRVRALKESGIVPGLAVVLVGNDPASETYVASKGKACEKLGISRE